MFWSVCEDVRTQQVKEGWQEQGYRGVTVRLCSKHNTKEGQERSKVGVDDGH